MVCYIIRLWFRGRWFRIPFHNRWGLQGKRTYIRNTFLRVQRSFSHVCAFFFRHKPLCQWIGSVLVNLEKQKPSSSSSSSPSNLWPLLRCTTAANIETFQVDVWCLQAGLLFDPMRVARIPWTCKHMYRHIYTYAGIHLYMHACIRICMYIYIYIYVYIYMYQ